MKRFLQLLILTLGLSAPAWAAEAVGTLELKGGRVLHNAKILSEQWDSVVVFATEGMIKVKKADLPAPLQAKYPMKEAPPPPPPPMVNPKVIVRQPVTRLVVPLPPKPEEPKSDNSGIYQGLMILNFHLKPMQASQGCIEVTIHNTGSETVNLTPAMIVCETPSGGKYVGKKFFSIVEQGMMVKNSDPVAPSADVTEIVFFQNDPVDMQSVHWAH